MRIPAFCGQCGAIYPSPINVKPGITANFSNVGVQCPNCGKMGFIPDGAYRVINEVLALLQRSEINADRLVRLAEILNKATQEQVKPKLAFRKIEKKLPEFSTITAWLHNQKNRMEVLAYLAILIPLLYAYLTSRPFELPEKDKVAIAERTAAKYAELLEKRASSSQEQQKEKKKKKRKTVKKQSYPKGSKTRPK